jgi:hypothetical protein
MCAAVALSVGLGWLVNDELVLEHLIALEEEAPPKMLPRE